MTPAPLAAYTEAARDADVFGSIVWFSVRQCDVSRQSIIDALNLCMLPKDAAPNNPGKSSAFRRACARYNDKRIKVNDDETRTIMLRTVTDDDKRLVRRLVVETRNASGEQLAYDGESYDLIFTKIRKSETAAAIVREGAKYGPPIDPFVSTTAHDVIRTYEQLIGTVSDGALRSVINRVLHEADAVTVRETGGVFFVPVVHHDLVERLEQFAEAFPAVDITAVPLPKAEKHRKMVVAAVQEATSAELTRLQTLLRQGLDEGMAADAAVKLNVEYQAVVERGRRYRELLEDQLESTNNQIDVLAQQMATLLTKAA